MIVQGDRVCTKKATVRVKTETQTKSSFLLFKVSLNYNFFFYSKRESYIFFLYFEMEENHSLNRWTKASLDLRGSFSIIVEFFPF